MIAGWMMFYNEGEEQWTIKNDFLLYFLALRYATIVFASDTSNGSGSESWTTLPP